MSQRYGCARALAGVFLFLAGSLAVHAAERLTIAAARPDGGCSAAAFGFAAEAAFSPRRRAGFGGANSAGLVREAGISKI